jgi:hypothetical protein
MVPDFDNLTQGADDCFDRLADGEMSEEERRQLLLGLDQEPDGWRRCAMSFLEAQCWKKELGELRHSMPAAAAEHAPPAQNIRRKAAPFGPLGTILAMAASFFLVLGIGAWWQHSSRHSSGTSAPFDLLAGKTGPQPATITSEPQTSLAQAASQPGATPWQLVRLTPAGSTDADQVIQLPAIQRDRLDEQWLKSLPSAIPEQVLQALQRSGYQVQTHESLMPLPLKDGRRLVLPVDQVELKYVGNKTTY